MKFTSLQLVNIDCQSGLVTDTEPLFVPMSKALNLFYLSQDQLQHVLGQSLVLTKDANNKLKLRIDQDRLRDNTYSVQPRNIRDDYFDAPLRVNFVDMVEGHTLIKETFSLEVRMPKIEIITTTKEVNRQNRS